MLILIFVKIVKPFQTILMHSWKLKILNKPLIKLLQLLMIKNKILSKSMVKKLDYLKFHLSAIFSKHFVVQGNKNIKEMDSLTLTKGNAHSQTNLKENVRKNKKRKRRRFKKWNKHKRKLKLNKNLWLNNRNQLLLNNKNQLLNKNQCLLNERCLKSHKKRD